MLERALANAALLAGAWPARRGLHAALRDPRTAQALTLNRLLAANSLSAYGRAHGLRASMTAREFQDTLPVASYEALFPWITRAMDGEAGVLTAEPVLLFEKTSGTSSAAKYVPYTAALQREFRRAVGAWLADVYASRPGLALGPAYWCVTPLARAPERTKGGLPVGFESDAEVLGGWVGSLLERRMAVPSAVARAGDLETGLYATLRFLLQEESLSFVSVWNPSFLTLLLARLETQGERLLDDLARGALNPPAPLGPELAAALAPKLRRMPGRARALRPLLARRAWTEVWPALGIVSCWADAAAQGGVPAVRAALPGVGIQGKGLLATEGVVTVPLTGFAGPVPALESHFLEFQPWDGAPCPGRPLLVHELEEGREYSVLLTTGGGLWRYELGDVVRVTGMAGRTPMLEFVGRGAAACDLRGEKLSAAFVGPVLAGLKARGLWEGDFAMLAPLTAEPPAYALFIEGMPQPALAAELDSALRANPHYDYCRRLGQLGPAAQVRVKGGAHESFLRRCRAAGQRAGAVKPAVLDPRPGWERWFAVEREAAV